MTRDELKQAMMDGIVSFDEAVAIMERENRHPGGRPKGVKNSGPSKLDVAIMALSACRSEMDEDELAMSERRFNAMITKQWHWGDYKERRRMLTGGAIKEEVDLVLQYKRSEDRVGMSRVKRIGKGSVATIGAGYDAPLDDDEPTEKELAGEVKRQKRHRPKRTVGYETAPEDFVEGSLEAEDEPSELWGVDVTAAVQDEQEELGFEPIRNRSSKRSWLAPINATQEFMLDGMLKVGAGDGSNGHAFDVPEPTIGECHRMALEDQCQDVEVCEPRRGSYRAPSLPVASLPRGKGEHRAGQYETMYRKLRKACKWISNEVMHGRLNNAEAMKFYNKAKKWQKPEGMLPEPPVVPFVLEFPVSK